jgi:hypothetical protein
MDTNAHEYPESEPDLPRKLRVLLAFVVIQIRDHSRRFAGNSSLSAFRVFRVFRGKQSVSVPKTIGAFHLNPGMEPLIHTDSHRYGRLPECFHLRPSAFICG